MRVIYLVQKMSLSALCLCCVTSINALGHTIQNAFLGYEGAMSRRLLG